MLTSDNPFHVHLGDCIEHMATLPDQCFDLCIHSPPFPSVYAYSNSDQDIGNSEDFKGDAKLHLSFYLRQLVRIMKPGRVVVIHVQQIPRMKRSGGRGLHDFRGLVIRLAERAGLIYEYDWLVRKNPQSQALRTKSHNLQFAGLERDRANSRGALCDYLIKFQVPGENDTPIQAEGQVSRNDWIAWAEGAWFDINETETLNGQKGKEAARSEEDTKHICPLQVQIIERMVRLYSDPGEIVFSPFAGIGSELVVALKHDRLAYGCELKPEYHAEAVRNCQAVERKKRVGATASIMSMLEDEDELSETA